MENWKSDRKHVFIRGFVLKRCEVSHEGPEKSVGSVSSEHSFILPAINSCGAAGLAGLWPVGQADLLAQMPSFEYNPRDQNRYGQPNVKKRERYLTSLACRTVAGIYSSFDAAKSLLQRMCPRSELLEAGWYGKLGKAVLCSLSVILENRNWNSRFRIGRRTDIMVGKSC